MLTVRTLSLLLVAWLVYMIKARPEGVPGDACETMDPGHGSEPQTTPCPYRLYLNKYDIYQNQKVMFTIEAPPDRKIRGFMVQARDFEQKPIGEFVITATDMKTIDCGEGQRNTASHTSSDPKDKVQMVWKPPEDYTGTVTFFATVAENRTTYWVRQPAEKVLSIKLG